MVASHNLVHNKAVLDTFKESFRNDEIINAPAYVFCSRPVHIAPPRIQHGIGVKASERILKATFEQLGELASLLVGESCAEMICFWIL